MTSVTEKKLSLEGEDNLFAEQQQLTVHQCGGALSDNVCFALYTAANALVRAYRPLLQQCDLTYPQYLVMQALWLQDNASLTDLSLSTRLDLGTLTPIVKRLESKGLVERHVDSRDERKKVIKVTPDGDTLKQEALALKQQLLDKVSVSAEQLEELRQLCLVLTEELNDK